MELKCCKISFFILNHILCKFQCSQLTNQVSTLSTRSSQLDDTLALRVSPSLSLIVANLKNLNVDCDTMCYCICSIYESNGWWFVPARCGLYVCMHATCFMTCRTFYLPSTYALVFLLVCAQERELSELKRCHSETVDQLTAQLSALKNVGQSSRLR